MRALALLLLLQLAAVDECSQGCPDDDEQGQCASDCQDCTCCPHGASVLTAASAKLAEASAMPPAREDEELPAAPEPQEPEQVPKV